MIVLWFHRICLCVLAISAVSCIDGNQSIAKRIADTERNAIEAVPFAAQFCRAFPTHQVALCGLESRRPYKREFQVTSFAYDRYLLYLEYTVEFQSARDMTVVGFSEPHFWIREVTEIFTAENGNTGLRFGEQFDFSPTEFEKLQESRFDLTLLGVPLKTNAPVAGFSDYKQLLLRKDW